MKLSISQMSSTFYNFIFSFMYYDSSIFLWEVFGRQKLRYSILIVLVLLLLLLFSALSTWIFGVIGIRSLGTENRLILSQASFILLVGNFN